MRAVCQWVVATVEVSRGVTVVCPRLLVAEINGSGDLAFEGLRTKRTEITVTGSGDANLDVAETLKAKVSGSGDVFYAGFPGKVEKKVTGSGSVEPGGPTKHEDKDNGG